MTDSTDVRLLIGTVVSATFTDANILTFLDLGGDSRFMAAALALKSAAATLVTTALKSEIIGDYEYTKGNSPADYLKIADNYEKRAVQEPAFDWAEMDLMDVGVRFGE